MSQNLSVRQAELGRLVETTRKKSASFRNCEGTAPGRKEPPDPGICQTIRPLLRVCGTAAREKTRPPWINWGNFGRQIARQFHTAPAQYQDWSDALWAVAERVQSGKVLLFFDEISWMGSKDPTFLGKIQNSWDQRLKTQRQFGFRCLRLSVILDRKKPF